MIENALAASCPTHVFRAYVLKRHSFRRPFVVVVSWFFVSAESPIYMKYAWYGDAQ